MSRRIQSVRDEITSAPGEILPGQIQAGHARPCFRGADRETTSVGEGIEELHTAAGRRDAMRNAAFAELRPSTRRKPKKTNPVENDTPPAFICKLDGEKTPPTTPAQRRVETPPLLRE